MLLPFNSFSQSITTLSCVDSSDSKYQMVVRFDETKIVFPPQSEIFESSLSKEMITYKTKVNRNIYTTIIYRTTGTYTVFAEGDGNRFTFSGKCSKVTQNKF